MDERPRGLWSHPDFLKLWGGQTISQFGSQITVLALPLTAALALQASPFQMGLLSAATVAPSLVVGLVAGVWVDRLRRRPILLAADLGRALLLLTIPLAAWLGALRMEVLYLAAFGTGLLTVFFDVAYAAYLPALVEREHLVEGNSKLETSRSAAQLAGPGLAGALVGLVTAPFALLVDALSFLLSACFLGAIRVVESAPHTDSRRRSTRREIVEGLRLVGGAPLLRALAGSAGTWNLSGGVIFAVFVLYVTRSLGLGPGVLGLVFAGGNAGFLLGALLAERVTRRFGPGRVMRWALTLGAVAWLLVPLASGPIWAKVPLLVAGQSLGSFGLTLSNVNAVSLRQALVPEHLRGRVMATVAVIGLGTSPLGFLIGGALGEFAGLRPTLAVGAALRLLVLAWVWFSPLRSLREFPSPPAGAHAA